MNLEEKVLAFDRYIEELFAPEDDILRGTRAAMHAGGLPSIAVSASEGKLLHVLILMMGARRILEVGTLGGYSTTWLARAMPADGTVLSLELSEHHADVARHNLEKAGFGDRAEVRVGAALDSLKALNASQTTPFDAIFIDADKDGYPDYLEQCVPLLREGGLLLGDNTLPDAVLDAAADSGTKRYNAAVAARMDLVSVVVPVLRSRGLDGLTISIKRTPSA